MTMEEMTRPEGGASGNPAGPEKLSWRRSLVGMILVLPIVLLLYHGLKRDPNPVDAVPARIGEPARDFTLTRMDDRSRVSLSAQRGNIVVLNFWAGWCTPCREEHGDLVRIANEYMPKGVQFYAVLHNDTEDGAKRFFEDLGPVPYPTLLPGTDHTGVEYGVTAQPETFVIDRSGRIAYKHLGPVSDTILRRRFVAALDSLLGAS
jgi:cytochrome c biogenesis protein CcmG/thiol:disulfide interchange protein DsbE